MIYIVRTDYFEHDIFGCFRSLEGARNAITKFIKVTNNLRYSDYYDYTYFVTDGSRKYYFEILCDVLED
jgi:hypothetical protein